ncbi:LysR family transcriptional regulator [Bradyrhizobium mercantei]|uniref:LysR family transcriptional regulator n=1 Tax=Bradyrhizobium mercantei TaxID=1904807 RepID=UPI0009783C34|nr:LysR family transcriptional regulator [Bradyrhizobium mercantei]
MDFRQLRLFVEIARTGSLNQAARNLHISQPAVSRHMQALEQDIGVQLFERRKTGMLLTKEGQRLVSIAEDMLKRADSLRQQIATGDGTVAGDITIGAAPPVGYSFFGPVAQRAAEEHPRINLHFTEGHAYDLLAGLEKHEIDISLMIDPDPQKALELIPLYSEPAYLLGPPNDPAFKRKAIALSELKHFPLVLYPRLTAPRKAIDKAVLRTRSTLNIRYESNHPPTMVDFVRRRLAYAIVPATLLGEKSSFSRMAIQNFEFVRSLVYLRSHPRTPEFMIALDMLKSETKLHVSRKRHEGLRLMLRSS